MSHLARLPGQDEDCLDLAKDFDFKLAFSTLSTESRKLTGSTQCVGQVCGRRFWAVSFSRRNDWSLEE